MSQKKKSEIDLNSFQKIRFHKIGHSEKAKARNFIHVTTKIWFETATSIVNY